MAYDQAVPINPSAKAYEQAVPINSSTMAHEQAGPLNQSAKAYSIGILSAMVHEAEQIVWETQHGCAAQGGLKMPRPITGLVILGANRVAGVRLAISGQSPLR